MGLFLLILFLFITLLIVTIKKFQEIDNLKKRIENVKKWNKLVTDLTPIIEKSSDLHNRGIEKDSEKYKEALNILLNNDVVSEATRTLFQDDSLLITYYGLRPGIFIDDLRMYVLKELILSFHKNY